MMRRTTLACCLLVWMAGSASARQPDGWRLGAQAYTFRRFTFFQTVETLAALDMKVVEAYPGQRIGGTLAGSLHHGMDERTRAKVRAKLAQAGVFLKLYGVVQGRNEAEWRQIFAFAKAMGIETLTSEPDPKHWDLIEKLCDEHEINLAIHNHPKPSRYWNPDTVLAAVKGRSQRMGACADTGHWARSELDPVDCLRKLRGRIISLHFKDLDERTRGGRDVIWGTGKSDADGMLSELARQGFAGVFSLEYEHDTPALGSDVRECVAFFRSWGSTGPGADPASRPVVQDVAQVWSGLKPGADGRWTPVDLASASKPSGGRKAKQGRAHRNPDLTKGYADTTDDRKGKVTACGPGFNREGPGNAFDNRDAKFCIRMRKIWIQYQYAGGAKHKVTAYTITTANDAPGRDPKTWQLLGSNDGKAWTEVDSRRGEKFRFRFETRLFPVKQPGAYSHYKLVVHENHDDVSSQLSEIELLVKKD